MACPIVPVCSGCAMLAGAVSRAAPELGVPATSRQAPRVPGELPFAERAPAVVRELAIITDYQPAVHVTPALPSSLLLMSARRTCFWTLPVAVMGRAVTISRRSGSFCVANFCARR